MRLTSDLTDIYCACALKEYTYVACTIYRKCDQFESLGGAYFAHASNVACNFVATFTCAYIQLEYK